MRTLIKIHILIVFSMLCNMVVAQHTWLWAETIDKSNTWNQPFYKPYNSVDKLVLYKADSANYCSNCSLSKLLWNGIEATKIGVYQLDKKSVLSIQKISSIKTKLLAEISKTEELETIAGALLLSEISIYRRATTANPATISELPIEWISIEIPFEKRTFILYLKAADCFRYLKSTECKWIHPVNHHIQLSISDALTQRNYIIQTSTVVSSSNLQSLANSKSALPDLAFALKNSDAKIPAQSIENTNDTLLIRLQAIYSADIRNSANRGFNKAHLIEFLLKLHAEKKINGYAYHEAGYFTPMKAKALNQKLLIESIEDGEFNIKRAPKSALTRIHFLKTYTKIALNNRISTDWILIGVGKELSTAFDNTYAIAFSYQEILDALSTTQLMWYNGYNQKDSMRLDDALRAQRIEYEELFITSMYGDTISYIQNNSTYNETKSTDILASKLYVYTAALIADFDAAHTRIPMDIKAKEKTESFQLNYTFTPESNSALTKNTLLIDALLDAIRSNKIKVYSDHKLKSESTSTVVINKLDKARFYKTSNAKKDSVYISKIPLEERFIKPSELTEFSICSNYSTTHSKSINTGISLGVFIPAELNPQYEPDTLCYVSFNALATFLQKNKAYKKLAPQFLTLLNERAIVRVEDFYDLVVYETSEENTGVRTNQSTNLPMFVRERLFVK